MKNATKENPKETNPTRIILITGFLGSGKTSLLKHLLSNYSAEKQNRIGVIVNEFGKISIDGPELLPFNKNITELNNGSIFCQCLAGTFVDSIARMLEKGLTDLYIESTGLADPSNMQSILQNVSKKTNLPYFYAGVLCVADAKYFRKLSQSSAMINRQILQSSIIILNKTDLITANELSEAKQAIRKLNPLAKILPASYGQIDISELNKLKISRLGRNLPSLNTPKNRTQTMIMQLKEPISRQDLITWTSGLKGHIFRLKGFVQLTNEKGNWQIDLVGGDITIVKSENDTISNSEIVIIPFIEPEKHEEIRKFAANTVSAEFTWIS